MGQQKKARRERGEAKAWLETVEASRAAVSTRRAAEAILNDSAVNSTRG